MDVSYVWYSRVCMSLVRWATIICKFVFDSFSYSNSTKSKALLYMSCIIKTPLISPSRAQFTTKLKKRTHGLSSSRDNFVKVFAKASRKVKLISPEGEEHEIEANKDCCILEAAENAGLELPYSCRSGTCGTFVGRWCREKWISH